MAEFLWTVAANGYEWADDHRGRQRDVGGPVGYGRVLVPSDLRTAGKGEGDEDFDFVAVSGRGLATRRYAPFRDESGLFRTFADTARSEQGMKAFADQFGMLGPDATESRPPVRGERLNEDARAFREEVHDYHSLAEEFGHWRRSILAMRKAVGLLERLPPPGRSAGPATVRLQGLDGEWLGVLGVASRIRLVAPPFGQPPLHVAPFTLHGAMWLQLARAAAGDHEFRQCRQCGQWYEVSPAVNRKSKLYCKERCRSQAYRERKTAAREMREAGRTVRQIASELESDVSTVRGWLGR